MERRLWNGYSFLFIRTPIAAIGILCAMVLGLNALMNGITVRDS